MLFRCSNRPVNVDVFMNSLEVVDTFTYLDVHLSSNGSFCKAQKHLSEHASTALYSLNSLYDNTCLCMQGKLKLFDSFVLPIMNYGSEVCGFHKSQETE